jgi:secreted trypsin-like serine protease
VVRRRKAQLATGVFAALIACVISLQSCASNRNARATQEETETIYLFEDEEFRVTDPQKLGSSKWNSIAAVVSSNRSVFCSGVLIDHITVLTAAHCACRHRAGPVFVTFGFNAYSPDEVRTVVQRRLRQGADCASPQSRRGADLALLTLNRTMAGSDYERLSTTSSSREPC